MLVIFLNALTIGLETNEEWKVNYGNVFKALDEFFLAIYTMEFIMKLYAEPKGYWKSSYNIFDVTILAISYVQLIMDEMNVGDNVLAPLRLLRGEFCIHIRILPNHMKRAENLFLHPEMMWKFVISNSIWTLNVEPKKV